MNTLHQFLLDTARQDWETWYDFTRLVFADWLEEAPRYDSARAEVIRLLAPDITDPSLERARRHCRRDVLGLFAEEQIEVEEACACAGVGRASRPARGCIYCQGSGYVTVHTAAGRLIPPEAVEPDFDWAYQAGQKMAEQFERRIIDAILEADRIKPAINPRILIDPRQL